MERTRLEIKVFDEVTVTDSLKKAIVVILEAFKKWVNSDRKEPFGLRVEKLANKAPPVLEVNVKEEIKTKTTFG